jgi:glycosyltransferase involved in cell wall biosynthesis
MKTGIIGTRGIPNHYGGFEQLAQYLSTGLVHKGHEVYVYNPHHHPYKEKTWNGVHILHCHDPEKKLGTTGQFFYDLNCINDARKRNFDVLLHLGYTSDALWHRRWPKKTKHLVNMDGLEWKRAKYSKPIRRFLKWAESLAARHADILIADSPGMQQYLMNEYGKKSVYIPYGARLFETPDARKLTALNLTPHSYCLMVARPEPENNIEMLIKGYLLSGERKNPLVIIGNTSNRFGRYLVRKYSNPLIKFPGAVFDQELLNNLRYYSCIYFHGHSVGGTNPSLLEAMACGCRIAAHDNMFNRHVLGSDAHYFSSEVDISAIIRSVPDEKMIAQHRQANFVKVKNKYSIPQVVNAYEAVMHNALSL